MSTKLISNITNITLVVISLVLTSLFFFGGVVPETAGTLYEEPLVTDIILLWTYLLFFIAFALVMAFAIVDMVRHPKSLVKGFSAIGALSIILLISYALADGTPLEIPGYTGPDNTSARLIITDIGLYTLYFLFGGALVSMLVSELSGFFK